MYDDMYKMPLENLNTIRPLLLMCNLNTLVLWISNCIFKMVSLIIFFLKCTGSVIYIATMEGRSDMLILTAQTMASDLTNAKLTSFIFNGETVKFKKSFIIDGDEQVDDTLITVIEVGTTYLSQY